MQWGWDAIHTGGREGYVRTLGVEPWSYMRYSGWNRMLIGTSTLKCAIITDARGSTLQYTVCSQGSCSSQRFAVPIQTGYLLRETGSCAPNKCAYDFHSPDGHSTRFYSARPRNSKGLTSRGNCAIAKGARWRRVFERAPNTPPYTRIETNDWDSAQTTRTRRIKAVFGGGK